MEFGFALAATAAETHADGRFSAVGAGLDGFIIEALPYRAPSLTIIMQLRFAPEECCAPQVVQISVEKPSGAVSAKYRGDTFTPAVDQHYPNRTVDVYHIMNIAINFDEYGIYKLKIFDGDMQIGVVEFGIAPETQAGGPDAGV